MLIAGAGRSDITPPVGIAHAGWGAATHQRAEGVDMPFYATALYVTDGELEIAIVDLDVGILTNQDDSEIRTKIASISGINSDNIILFTWISSSMLAGLAGIFQATINDIRYNMGFLILLLIFAGTVLGGIGTSFGAMIGGLLIGIIVQVSVALPFMEGHTEAKNAVAPAIMILILLFRPQGIFGEKERVS